MAVERFPARGFGPGLPPTGQAVSFHLSGENLHVAGWPGVDRVARQQLQLRHQGAGLGLEWSTAAGRCALLVEGKSGAGPAALTAWLPPVRRSSDGATHRWQGAVLFLLFGLPLLLLALFFAFRGELVDAVVARIPVAQEQRLAEALWAIQRTQLKPLEGTAANRFIEEVGARLVAARPTPYQYRFHLVDDRQVNAFAMPAGHVVVNRGLIEKAASPEEVAGVLAHEIEHVEQRHGLRGLVQALGLAALWLAFTGDLEAGLAGQWVQQLAGMQFSREQESAADAGGLARLLAADVDPRGMASFFERLAQAQGDIPGALSWLSTHPASAERAARLRDLLRDAPVPPPLAGDWPAVQASLAR